LFPLGDVCRTTSGGTPSRKRADYFQGDIPWVKSGELTDGLVSDVSEFITEEAVANSSAKLFPLGTLLIAMYGATVGKLGVLTKPAATNQAVCAIFPPPELDSKFLFWFLRFKRSYLIDQAVGGAQPNISQSILRELMVPVPPINVQREVVAEIEKHFSRLDEAVANLQRVKANLNRYKASVLKAAVEGRLVETEASIAQREGRSFETGEQLLQRILQERRAKW
jgi:type I restriction enzyme, S subunit